MLRMMRIKVKVSVCVGGFAVDLCAKSFTRDLNSGFDT